MPDDLTARARQRAEDAGRYMHLRSLAQSVWFYDQHPATITHDNGTVGYVYTLLMNIQNDVRRDSDGIADLLTSLADRVDEQERRIEELEGEKDRLRRELNAAVEHHARYVQAIDLALDEPRQDDCEIMVAHVNEIQRLKGGGS